MDIKEALKEYSSIIKHMKEEYTQEDLTVNIIRKEHKELGFMDDDEIEELISHANKCR